MKDSEILDKVYEKLKLVQKNYRNYSAFISSGTVDDTIQYIEEEWQTADYLARRREAGAGEQGEVGNAYRGLNDSNESP